MNALAKRALSLSVPAILGAGAGVAGTLATNGAHETITLAIGDTLVPRFSVTTDTVLHVAGTNIVARSCGASHIFLRTWQHNQIQRSADTVDVDIPCIVVPPPPKDTLASIEVCLFPNPDSAAKYHVSADTGIDPKLVPCDSATGTLKLDTVPSPQQQKKLGSIMFKPQSPAPSSK